MKLKIGSKVKEEIMVRIYRVVNPDGEATDTALALCQRCVEEERKASRPTIDEFTRSSEKTEPCSMCGGG